MEKQYIVKTIDLVTLVVILIGALNWGLIGVFNWNMVAALAKVTFKGLERAVYVLVGFAALVHLLRRDYYLPFLGDAAVPCGMLITKRPKDANQQVLLNTDAPEANVIYWAAEPAVDKKIKENPWIAYAEYANAGVTRTNTSGVATLYIRGPPAQYKVKGGMKTLDAHVHYRICRGAGMLGPVRTLKL